MLNPKDELPRKSHLEPFMKNVYFEEVMEAVNELLLPLEKSLTRSYSDLKYPIIFIGGTQRSGSTLLLQLIKAFFNVGYVSNLIARFWMVPYIGSLLANELRQRDIPRHPDFNSILGTTYSYDGPHEFGFFWQRWFPHGETHLTDQQDVSKINREELRRELAAIESVFDAPLTFKNPIVFSLNIPTLADIFPNSLFLISERNPIFVAQSTLRSRLRAKNQKDYWLSVKPDEYRWLKKLTYPEQIAGQIYYTRQHIDNSLKLIDPNRYRRVQYENLCVDPLGELMEVNNLVLNAGYQLERTGFSPDLFLNSNEQKIADDEFKKIVAAVKRYYD